MAFDNRPVSELTSRMQQLFERARASFQGGRYSYTMELLRTILVQEPGCSEVRRVLHAACREVHAKDSVVTRLSAAVKTFLPLRMKVPRLFRNEQYPALLELLEDLLQQGAPPRSPLEWMHRLSETCNLPELGTVAVESLVAARKEDPRAWRTYVDHCRKHDLHKRALQGLRRLRKLCPNDAEIQSELRQVTAADTVAEAHWDEVGTYREVLRDEDETQRLADERRPAAMATEESLRAQVAAAKADVSSLPTTDNRRRLGNLMRQAGDLDGALTQYEQASADTKNLDPALDDAITSSLIEQAEADIERWRKFARDNADRAGLAEERIRELETRRDASLLERYEDRARRFPIEARYQADLADLYLAAERFDEALCCYQAARRNATFKLRAGIGAARSLAGKGLLDLAEREFKECLAQLPARGHGERLSVLYDLFCLCHGMEREEDALQYLKEIYTIDASYRDVGARLDEYVRSRDAVRAPARDGSDEKPS